MSSSEVSFTVIMPVYGEGASIVPHLDRVFEVLAEEAEVLVVYDDPGDPTVPYLAQYGRSEPRLKPLLNTYGRGPSPAIRFGLGAAASDVAVITMADGSDRPEQINELAALVRGGAVLAAASRYMRGGRQVGGPLVKRVMSRLAGISLHHLARVPIHDPTSAFKGYSLGFVRSVGVDSSHGFELALELVAKAHRLRLPMTEIPTTWVDRAEGESHFRLMKWLPGYLRWYLFAFGRRLTLDELHTRRPA